MTSDIQLLINCSKNKPTATDIAQIREHASRIDGQALSEITALAQSHGVFPLLYQAIRAHAAELIPEESLADLRRVKSLPGECTTSCRIKPHFEKWVEPGPRLSW